MHGYFCFCLYVGMFLFCFGGWELSVAEVLLSWTGFFPVICLASSSVLILDNWNQFDTGRVNSSKNIKNQMCLKCLWTKAEFSYKITFLFAAFCWWSIRALALKGHNLPYSLPRDLNPILPSMLRDRSWCNKRHLIMFLALEFPWQTRKWLYCCKSKSLTVNKSKLFKVAEHIARRQHRK